MDERKHYTDWDDSIYGTGPTQPPKSRGGLVALLLILIIFLCGIVTVLGILNVRMCQQLKLREDTGHSYSKVHLYRSHRTALEALEAEWNNL